MKNIKLGCLFFVLTIILVSCAGKKPVVVQNTVTTEKTITETLHDTVFRTEIDSSSYRALLECVNGKPVIKNVTHSEPGRNLKSPKVRIDDKVLIVDCVAAAQEVIARWKSKYIKEHQQEIKEVPVITNELTWLQKAQIKGFRILAIILFLIVVWSIVKYKFKKPI